jgi:hypothetical protein
MTHLTTTVLQQALEALGYETFAYNWLNWRSRYGKRCLAIRLDATAKLLTLGWNVRDWMASEDADYSASLIESQLASVQCAAVPHAGGVEYVVYFPSVEYVEYVEETSDDSDGECHCGECDDE